MRNQVIANRDTIQERGVIDLRLKEQALSRVDPLGVKPSRYRPADHLLRFLESL